VTSVTPRLSCPSVPGVPRPYRTELSKLLTHSGMSSVLSARTVKQHLKILKISTPWTGSLCVGPVLEFRSEERRPPNSFHALSEA